MRRRNWFGGLAVLALASALAFGQSGNQIYIGTSVLPDGAVGVAYSTDPLQAYSQYTEFAPITWSVVSGQFPSGLSLSSDGNITGVPTSGGTFSFVVQAYESGDFYGSPLTATQPLTILVTGSGPSITTASLPAGKIGVAYSQKFSASGVSQGDITAWDVANGTLPPGLTLSAAGVLAGTPTAAGTYTFIIELRDRLATGALISVTQSYTLVIASTAKLSITTGGTLAPGSVGVAYTQTIAATGGVPQYSWNLSGGTLPDGITLNALTGVVSGAPKTAGTFNFQLTVTDQADGKATGDFSIFVSAPLSITSGPALPSGATGTAYSVTLAAQGGTTPYAWSVLTQPGPLPPGLTLNTVSGVLSGTPSAGGTYQFVVQITDDNKRTASKQMTIVIGSQLTISTVSPLPNGAVGTAYQAQLNATGGTQPYTWSINVGALPAGVTINSATGMISGTPTAGGTFTVNVQVMDAIQTATKQLALTITTPTLPAVTITGLPDTPPPATQPGLGVSLSSSYSLDITGHATLAFAPDGNADDPAVQFTTGGRSANFQVPAGTTQAVFTSSSLGVQTGTVAGTITITLQIFAAGADVTPTPAPTKVLRIAGAAPVITSASVVASPDGFNLVVVGYSTTREVTGATVHLTPSAGKTLATSDFSIPLTSAFTTWYQDPASLPFGSQFTLTIPFAVHEVANAVSSLSVTLTNSQGTSAAANATF